MKTTLLFLCLFSSISFAQNLVLNPSFEWRQRDDCMVFLGDFKKHTQHWSIPNNGSTDSFIECSKSHGTKNYNGHQQPKTGEAYAGIYTFSSYKNYREYIQGQLKQPLKKGETYTVSIYVSLADRATHATKDIQILFTEAQLKGCFHKNKCEKVIVPKKTTVKPFKLYDLPSDDFLDSREAWQELTFQFVASGFERHFSIGNFNNDRKTHLKEILRVSRKEHKFSYYYLDDVSITPQTVVVAKTETRMPKPYENNTDYVLSNVLFEFDKAVLLPTSKAELNQLLNHLKTHPELHIEVYGHTDAVGAKAHNKKLSEQRAKAVSTYLIEQGLDTKRIQWFGYGSSRPIATNDTELGRAQNRRVVFRLISQ